MKLFSWTIIQMRQSFDDDLIKDHASLCNSRVRNRLIFLNQVSKNNAREHGKIQTNDCGVRRHILNLNLFSLFLSLPFFIPPAHWLLFHGVYFQNV